MWWPGSCGDTVLPVKGTALAAGRVPGCAGEAVERARLIAASRVRWRRWREHAPAARGGRRRDPAAHSGRDNLETMAIVDAAYLSAARGGARIEVAELGSSLPA
jgi:hypothetical protein